MEVLKNLGAIITDESITLFWDKPEDAQKGDRYRIFLNRELIGGTGQTFYMVTGLDSNRLYLVEIKREREKKEEVLGDIVCSTKKEKEKLWITDRLYNALGDGKTINTRAIQKAIDDCGSGQAVCIPKGVFLTGALFLHSDMELYLEEGAVLLGTDKAEDYLPKIPSRFEGTELSCYSSLLNLGHLERNGGYNCRNVVIGGKGTIASGGKILAERVIGLERERMREELEQMGDRIQECENEDTIPGRVRPRLIHLCNCQNVTISGLTLKNGACWNVHMIYSDQVITNGCTFYSEGVWNGDGWDPDSSTNCTIFDCSFYTGDDSVSIKSGKNPEGNVIGKPSRGIRIFSCKGMSGHGITIGSEMSGGVEDVYIWDCDMSKSLYGIEIKGTKKRGGYVRNVRVRDCCLSRVLFHSVGYNDDGEGAPVPPVFEGCSFEDIEVKGRYRDREGRWSSCQAIELCGFDEPGHELRDISFRRARLGSGEAGEKQTISLALCSHITFEDISVV